jgi:hypothetical protein
MKFKKERNRINGYSDADGVEYFTDDSALFREW